MLTRRFVPLYLACVIFISFYYLLSPSRTPEAVDLQHPFAEFTKPPLKDDGKFNWAFRKEDNPVTSMIPLPTGIPPKIPTIQHAFGIESPARTAEITKRRTAVKASFDRAWEGYKNHAWMKDELAPISGTGRNKFGGWAATLVDTLDTLWIMEKTVDFEQAVANVKDIDFSQTEDEELNAFETTIRYLGGLLAANDLSEGKYPQLLEKALEVGNLLYAAFDTPNRMPITRWKWQKYIPTSITEEAVLMVTARDTATHKKQVPASSRKLAPSPSNSHASPKSPVTPNSSTPSNALPTDSNKRRT
jgi:mannosyl-oligosaccharide alpha-1,2-mannosidase